MNTSHRAYAAPTAVLTLFIPREGVAANGSYTWGVDSTGQMDLNNNPFGTEPASLTNFVPWEDKDT